eukprot:CAMPEP_0183319158 /NCGR_PEP_ID=MMETSP0160_2-20130417/62741_1 /TAXON_ID=2839 ORGANISM="Odontella Sinensis, Strain Grunow 1884" /NCGR_SAMPLE_ID=MMETSP0160_2 /ASSEMBLY_ACC=CAM_ASM_000250 /LENGTH=116 /DNA_ID=CAMNT_0025485585 /DNA_START=254 /DNA_END=601 /DNA_ORIENTATION=+
MSPCDRALTGGMSRSEEEDPHLPLGGRSLPRPPAGDCPGVEIGVVPGVPTASLRASALLRSALSSRIGAAARRASVKAWAHRTEAQEPGSHPARSPPSADAIAIKFAIAAAAVVVV